MSDDKEFAAELRVAGRKGSIHIHDYIGADLMTGGGIRSKDVIAQLAAYGDLSEIEVHINSAGGSAWDGIAMHNALKQHKARVTVEVDGLAASAASVVAMAGDTIRMADGAYLMLHNPRGGAMGEAADLRKRAEMLDRIRDSILGIYAAKSGRKPEEIGRLLDEETWMNADEAREFGFVDEVVERPAVAACLDLSGFSKVPEAALKLVSEEPVMAEKKKDTETAPPTPPAPQPNPAPEPTPTPTPTPEPAPVQPGSRAAEATNAAPAVDVDALIAAERQRVQHINAKCSAAGVPQSEINRLVDSGADVNAVNAFLVGHLIANNRPVASDAADDQPGESDPDAKLKAEYEADAAFIRKSGVEPVSLEAYIKSRKRSA